MVEPGDLSEPGVFERIEPGYEPALFSSANQQGRPALRGRR
jgi:hypothetical protein